MSDNPICVYVEDDPMSRKVMEFMLKNLLKYHNYNIFEDSHNFIERIEAISPRPTLFLLDIHVPPYDGVEMLKMLRQHPAFSGVKVVALTASVMNEEVKELKEAGFDSCIAKPIDAATFPELLRRILNGDEVWRVK